MKDTGSGATIINRNDVGKCGTRIQQQPRKCITDKWRLVKESWRCDPKGQIISATENGICMDFCENILLLLVFFFPILACVYVCMSECVVFLTMY